MNKHNKTLIKVIRDTLGESYLWMMLNITEIMTAKDPDLVNTLEPAQSDRYIVVDVFKFIYYDYFGCMLRYVSFKFFS